MKNYIMVFILTILASMIYLTGIRGYNAFENGWFYSQKNHNKWKIKWLDAHDLAKSRQDTYGWTDEQRIKWMCQYRREIQREYNKGIYLPFLSIFEEK